jgi:hypothetical protein
VALNGPLIVLVRHDMMSAGGGPAQASSMEIPMAYLPGNRVTPVPTAEPYGQTPSNYHTVPATTQQPSGQVTSMFTIKRM